MENKKLNPSREDNIYSLFESVIPDFHKAKKGVNGWMTSKCPLHEDKNPSFSFNLNGGWNCFSGCGKGDAALLAEKLGMDPKPYYTHVLDNNHHGFKPVVTHAPKRSKVIPIKLEYITVEELNEHLDPGEYKNNNYALFLKDTFGAEAAKELQYEQYIGTWQKLGPFKGAAMFYYIDKYSMVCSVKIQQYNRDGNRVKKPKALTFSEHPKSWKRCLYNERLIKLSNKNISIVESEKTANLMSLYRPDNIWLAVGGSGLNAILLEPLIDRNISLYPDQGFYDKWSQFAKENPEYKIEVSKDCEYWFEQKEIAAGGDIADYYLKNHNLRYDAQWNQDEYNSLFSKK